LIKICYKTRWSLGISQSFKEWENDEVEPCGHLEDQNVSMNSKKIGWKPGGHQVEHNPFKGWKRDELKLGSHLECHNVHTDSKDLDENLVATMWNATFLRSEKKLN
jgi:hypothetical protein